MIVLRDLADRYRKDVLWVVIGALLGLVALFSALFIVPLIGPGSQGFAPTTIVTVIANPSATSSLTPSPTETAPPVPTSTATPPAAGELSLGELVQVVGTGGDGLRLRSEPGLEAAILILAFENEVFVVREGPVESDDYVWWYLVNPYDETKVGWGASNFLRPVDE